ncbi:hypothetical protein [Mesorhizobium sp. WSM4982]|uniref:hypothetical protein n=1 Tax=Mesorhizobium sp. WSM4982 TaxID=3038550 RepID=UPI002414F030|nr:hypothetical protein [Mesorhizobium sp. WSM4982]MDG4856417.1 hypothetical protein [Mesorhizobium sp. WSM4982]
MSDKGTYKIDRSPSGWWRYAAFKRGLFGWWWRFAEGDYVDGLRERIQQDAKFPILFNDKGEPL